MVQKAPREIVQKQGSIRTLNLRSENLAAMWAMCLGSLFLTIVGCAQVLFLMVSIVGPMCTEI